MQIAKSDFIMASYIAIHFFNNYAKRMWHLQLASKPHPNKFDYSIKFAYRTVCLLPRFFFFFKWDESMQSYHIVEECFIILE